MILKILHGLGLSRMFTSACQKGIGVRHVPGEPGRLKQMMGWSSGEKVPLISAKNPGRDSLERFDELGFSISE